MPVKHNLTGRIFGRWVVLREAEPKLYGGKPTRQWLCCCLCGVERVLKQGVLLRGTSTQCNKCGHGDCGGLSKLHRREYTSWRGAKSRCTDPRDRGWRNYGGRGISVCDRWMYGESGISAFACFVVDMGPRPSPKHSLDRINNDGNYEPGNCRWATLKQQHRNTRRTRFLTVGSITKCVRAWAEEYGIDSRQIHMRLNRGWSVEDAITKPIARKVSA